MTENEIANKIIGLAIEVHKALGTGLLESAYKECLIEKNSSTLCVGVSVEIVIPVKS